MREPLTGTLAIRLDASRRAALTVKRSGFLPRRARSSTALRGYRQKMRTDATASYGRHGNTLSPHEHGPEGRTGYAGWGQYENGHLEVYHGRGVTLDTLDHMEAVTACLRSASVLAVTMYRPRGQNIAYCDTCEHNDRQRGDTMSLFRWLKSGRACLLIRTDVLFYVSLVTFHGVSFLPICVHPPTQAGADSVSWWCHHMSGMSWQCCGGVMACRGNVMACHGVSWRCHGGSRRGGSRRVVAVSCPVMACQHSGVMACHACRGVWWRVAACRGGVMPCHSAWRSVHYGCSSGVMACHACRGVWWRVMACRCVSLRVVVCHTAAWQACHSVSCHRTPWHSVA
jgi:hypothetical protein